MKAIYANKIYDVQAIRKLNDNQDYYDILLQNSEELVKEKVIAFEHYEYEGQPLYFLEQPMTEKQKLDLIQKFDEWYGNTDQETTVWALEFQIIVRMLLQGYLVINPYYLALEEVLTDILDCLQD
uniref:hypothetical protein n=1 Tax=Candidatus Fimivicinus sp. TaxID=3056640 RepID=UPI004028281C